MPMKAQYEYFYSWSIIARSYLDPNQDAARFYPWKYSMQFKDETENPNQDTAKAENAVAGWQIAKALQFL